MSALRGDPLLRSRSQPGDALRTALTVPTALAQAQAKHRKFQDQTAGITASRPARETDDQVAWANSLTDTSPKRALASSSRSAA